MVASFLALGVIVAAVLFGFSLGLVFSGLMVALFAGYVVYDTSNIIHRYGVNEHVAASMALFGSFAMLFYYILRIFLTHETDRRFLSTHIPTDSVASKTRNLAGTSAISRLR